MMPSSARHVHEFQRHYSTARESNSINELITQFEEKLRKLNLGLEVWGPTIEYVEDEEENGEDHEGEPIMQPVRTDTELGFTRHGETWHLMIRDARYRYDDGRWEFATTTMNPYRLLDASRQTRIKALGAFPALLKELHAEAKEAIAAIQDAKKLVK